MKTTSYIARFGLVTLLASLATTSVTQDLQQYYLPVTIRSCHSVILSIFDDRDLEIQKLQNKLREISDWSIGKYSLSAYRHAYMSCFRQVWALCLSGVSIQALKRTLSSSNFPCSKFSVEASSHATYLHTITTKSTYQINLTFTTFFLRRSHSGCTKHYVKV